MSFGSFLKAKALSIIMMFVACLIGGTLLSLMRLDPYVIGFILFWIVLAWLIPHVVEYLGKRSFYHEVAESLRVLDKKYLIADMISEPPFAEGQALYDALKISNKAMNDEISKYTNITKEYREYIELWIHEVKTPIASSKLLIENNRSELTNALEQEIDRIDYFLEQALYYSRSNSVEQDFIIRKTPLEALVQETVRKNAKRFIREKIKVSLEHLDYDVYTDAKWAGFILGQLVDNAIKYCSDNAEIRFSARQSGHNVVLIIADNGIGIRAEDLPRVFQKGFTGTTGRKYAKSTGMGLYLCRKLCDKLGMPFALTSKEGKGTTIEIIFTKNGMLEMK